MDIQPTKEEIAEYKEAFSLFDKSGDGYIDVKWLGMLIRSLNKNPTEDELQEIQLEIDPNSQGVVEFPDFLTAMVKRNKEVDPEEELQEAFRVLFPQIPSGKGAPIQTFRHLLSTGQDGFSETELDDMVQMIDPNGTSEFKIETFIKIVIDTMEKNRIR
ncbi:hypothetical protein PPERSA_10587 [Pseudocohnilembus persalinus]|uniref:Calmodulin n=1 Tax=Pseudocohnilembus persalinus TaxID=266149 RepID=A0A0V0Q9A1_PSEPJ|nr:hypothetical protein PPERSA_10587 [Pseudocohnilembus persalinus]|eukprot:KRW98816.1 hypothetical protein PPERSA_10587 [Pseudocohnilembus persalinus]